MSSSPDVSLEMPTRVNSSLWAVPAAGQLVEMLAALGGTRAMWAAQRTTMPVVTAPEWEALRLQTQGYPTWLLSLAVRLTIENSPGTLWKTSLHLIFNENPV